MRPKIVLYYNDVVFSPSETFLFKDFGQVPFVLSELHDTDLEYWISSANPNANFVEFRGKRVRQFSKANVALPRRFDILKNRLLYRTIEADRRMTHLVIFPFTPVTDLEVARRAKRSRPKLSIIVKLDTNVEFLTHIAQDWRRFGATPARVARQSYHYRELLRIADVLLIETDACDRLLRQGFMGLDLGPKLLQTYSGLSERWLTSLGIDPAAQEGRRKSIIVSGRISSPQKYTGLIFAAGPPPPGWMVEFVGEVDEGLANLIKKHRALDPEFDKHYRFHGAVTDKRAYFQILLQAQALLMNSRGGEGFPNVFAEAHFCGLTIITSDVSGAEEATCAGRWGMVYPREDASALRAALQTLSEMVKDGTRHPAPEAYRRRFIWEHSLDQPEVRRLFEEPQQLELR